MKQRCLNPNRPDYARYGGRGIQICPRWRDSFDNFLADMGEPKPGESLDRLNNDLGYAPENCRWATDTEQANNKRTTRRLTYDGRTRTLAEWARLTSIGRGTLAWRLREGWPIERVLTEPVRT